MKTVKAKEFVANTSCDGTVFTSFLGETLGARNPAWSRTVFLLGAVLQPCYCHG